jgi:hypothetical protein
MYCSAARLPRGLAPANPRIREEEKGRDVLSNQGKKGWAGSSLSPVLNFAREHHVPPQRTPRGAATVNGQMTNGALNRSFSKLSSYASSTRVPSKNGADCHTTTANQSAPPTLS